METACIACDNITEIAVKYTRYRNGGGAILLTFGLAGGGVVYGVRCFMLSDSMKVHFTCIYTKISLPPKCDGVYKRFDTAQMCATGNFM